MIIRGEGPSKKVVPTIITSFPYKNQKGVIESFAENKKEKLELRDCTQPSEGEIAEAKLNTADLMRIEKTNTHSVSLGITPECIL